MSMLYSASITTENFAGRLATGLQCELDLTPKPGLVDRWNSGSHDDLSYPILLRSVELLARYFLRCAQALDAGAPVEHLRGLGRDTEADMLRMFSTNTHRGAIFLGALMLAGVHRASCDDAESVRVGICAAAQELFDVSVPKTTPGAAVRSRYRVGGIIRDAQLLAMSRLMQTVEDTTTLRRCGEFGLHRLRNDGRRLERTLVDGCDPIEFLVALNHDYRAARMTMGGVADLLGLAFAWHYRPEPGTELLDHAAMVMN